MRCAVTLLAGEPRVVSVGAESLADALRDQATPVLTADWRPPYPGTEDDLATLLADPRRTAANAEAARRMQAAEAH